MAISTILDAPIGNPYCLGNLTGKQYKKLEALETLGYSFVVVRYDGGPSSVATHVKVYKNDEYVGLVGKNVCQYYDSCLETQKLVSKIVSKIYNWTAIFE